jgi:hypothetical protein
MPDLTWLYFALLQLPICLTLLLLHISVKISNAIPGHPTKPDDDDSE